MIIIPHTVKLYEGISISLHLSIRPACCVCSAARCLFHGLYSYIAQMEPMRAWCIAYHFKINRSKVKVTWDIIPIFAVQPRGIFVNRDLQLLITSKWSFMLWAYIAQILLYHECSRNKIISLYISTYVYSPCVLYTPNLEILRKMTLSFCVMELLRSGYPYWKVQFVPNQVSIPADVIWIKILSQSIVHC